MNLRELLTGFLAGVLYPVWLLAGAVDSFEISMGTRRDDVQLRRDLDQALERASSSVHKVLGEYGVPLIGCATTLPRSDR